MTDTGPLLNPDEATDADDPDYGTEAMVQARWDAWIDSLSPAEVEALTPEHSEAKYTEFEHLDPQSKGPAPEDS